ncbi:triphosphoribosyl-dephospho-CoA synthase [Streptomyces huiliensis]|uniref:triphosphoribosyl-dephospho-CoA synthase n=1 Tax=Streptomyces huiliensis TaxID=2876027 RepID=UPI001CBEBCEF|nr:triphosphoribosyl-dephospho-CoA synthase [Streptomyces huiliensis]MBZ4321618.1 triphosphoribosyl-dephospho-CoA synthase [Streptomyces huiliensis]
MLTGARRPSAAGPRTPLAPVADPAAPVADRAAGAEDAAADRLAAAMVYGLTAEAVTWPKPGLVTAVSAGCHRDMDVYTLLRSSAVLQPAFRSAVLFGLRRGAVAPAARDFAELRAAGRRAEHGMLAATGGTNTHRGALFLGMLLCCAAGIEHAAGRPLEPEAVCRTAREVSRDALQADLTAAVADPASVGLRAYAVHGLSGVRGEVLRGWPSLLGHGLPALRAALGTGRPPREAVADAVLALMAVVEDTTVLNRGFDPERLATTRREAAAALAAGGTATWRGRRLVGRMARRLERRQISPGGSADLAAMAIALHTWQTGTDATAPRKGELRAQASA